PLALGVCWAKEVPAAENVARTATTARRASFTDRSPREVWRADRRAIRIELLGGFLDGAMLGGVGRIVIPGAAPVGKRVGKLVQIEIDDRRRKQGQCLADKET